MNIACDIDGVISSAPEQMQIIMDGLRKEGHYVAVISASDPNSSSPSGDTWQSKCEFLQKVGFTAWDELVVVTGNIAKLKAQWCKDHAVQIFCDNNKDNARAAVKAGIPLVLVPWASRV